MAVEHRDGRRETVTFASRLEAEQWLGLLPWRQAAGDDDVASIGAASLVTAAMWRPEDARRALSLN